MRIRIQLSTLMRIRIRNTALKGSTGQQVNFLFLYSTFTLGAINDDCDQGFGSGSGSAWIRINLSCWIKIRIRIQIAAPDPDPAGQKLPKK
jgi:hypothetical protein